MIKLHPKRLVKAKSLIIHIGEIIPKTSIKRIRVEGMIRSCLLTNRYCVMLDTLMSKEWITADIDPRISPAGRRADGNDIKTG